MSRRPAAHFRHAVLVAGLGLLALVLLEDKVVAADNTFSVIEKVKASVVGVGTFERTRARAFKFLGTGFAVGDGNLIVTNAHVLPQVLESERQEVLAIVIPGTDPGTPQLREARQVAIDHGSDLALIKINGQSLPPLKIAASDRIREGQSVLFTGFPIGSVLGPYPATHRGMISAITPIVIPPATSAELDPHVVRRLTTGSYPILQLDATAYPGNSGSPVYDPESGDVIGVVNLVFVKGTKEAALTQPSGITYAISSKQLQEFLQKAR